MRYGSQKSSCALEHRQVAMNRCRVFARISSQELYRASVADPAIYLVMRLYWPKTTPPSILPAGEGTWKPPAVEKVS
jgi:hypothetical protein